VCKGRIDTNGLVLARLLRVEGVNLANGWTTERKAHHAELINTWRPWEHSTGPRSAEGKAKASRNAWKGGTRPVLRELARALREQGRVLHELGG
jgi:hypothetical protein